MNTTAALIISTMVAFAPEAYEKVSFITGFCIMQEKQNQDETIDFTEEEVCQALKILPVIKKASELLHWYARYAKMSRRSS